MVFPSHSLRIWLICDGNLWEPIRSRWSLSSGSSSDFGHFQGVFVKVLNRSRRNNIWFSSPPVIACFDTCENFIATLVARYWILFCAVSRGKWRLYYIDNYDPDNEMWHVFNLLNFKLCKYEILLMLIKLWKSWKIVKFLHKIYLIKL